MPRKSITFMDTTYPTQSAFEKYVKNLIYNEIGICYDIKNTSPLQYDILIELLKRHPDYDEKCKNMCNLKIVGDTLNKAAYKILIVKNEGEIDISDLKKLVSFCKKISKDNILIRQMGSGKTLYVNGGSTKLQLPTSNTIISHTKTPLINKLITEAKDTMWTTWTPQKLEISTHGDISASELLDIAKMKDIVKPEKRVLNKLVKE